MQKIQDMWVQSLGQEDPLEEEMVTHSSILAWKIPWTEEPIVHGLSIDLCLYRIEIMTIIVQEEEGPTQAHVGITGTCTTQELVWFIWKKK